jgi:hypothetical protein
MTAGQISEVREVAMLAAAWRRKCQGHDSRIDDVNVID